MHPDTPAFDDVVAAVPLFAPVGEDRRGRVSSTTVAPGGGPPVKVVVDFGSTPEGPDNGPDLEIATRVWEGGDGEDGHGPGERDIRAFCAERDLMERRMRDPLAAQSFALPADAAWSAHDIAVDGADVAFTVLRTSASWVAAGALPGGALVRVFTPAPGPGPDALRRITEAAELAPVHGRG
ncbi:hypothetical protein ACFOVU_29090 [Nocardiopsis sediminis]|uniref:Uncharacterized protein n=1 Tax=Nocardiopsis sediminis TaxID=1778267 RepID=A0ABV8FY23_9ACTN